MHGWAASVTIARRGDISSDRMWSFSKSRRDYAMEAARPGCSHGHTFRNRRAAVRRNLVPPAWSLCPLPNALGPQRDLRLVTEADGYIAIRIGNQSEPQRAQQEFPVSNAPITFQLGPRYVVPCAGAHSKPTPGGNIQYLTCWLWAVQFDQYRVPLYV